MLNVTDTTKTAYLENIGVKTLTVSCPELNINFTHSDIVLESTELAESIEDSSNLEFKGCIASRFSFDVANFIQDIRGRFITATIRSGNTETIPLFSGYVDEQTNLTHQDITTKITAYDVLYKVGSTNMSSWLNGLTYPITVANFRNSLFTTLGITQETITLPNDTLTISADIKNFAENPTALQLMQWICQINARYGQIGRDNKFHYRKLTEIFEGTYPGATTYPGSNTYPGRGNSNVDINTSQYITVRYEPFNTERITKVAIIDEDGEVGSYYGSGTNIFTISDNPIAYCVNMETASHVVYDEIHLLYFVPVTDYKGIGLPFVECGDVVKVVTHKNNITTYVLNRTLKGMHGLFDIYTSSVNQYQPDFKQTNATTQSSLKSGLLQNQSKTQSVYEEVFDNQGRSRIALNASSISSEVSRAEGVEGNLNSKITQNATDILAKVSKNSPTGQTSFSWQIDDVHMEWKANNRKIMLLNADGLEIKGKVTATSGYIGTEANGFSISPDSISNGVTSMSDTTHNGIYIGTDGINLGQGKFKVTSAGSLTATSGSIGPLDISNTGLMYNQYPVLDISNDIVSLGYPLSEVTIQGIPISLSSSYGSIQLDLDGVTISSVTDITIGGHVIMWAEKGDVQDTDLILCERTGG